MTKISWSHYARLLLPSAILIAIGVAWIILAINKACDPQNYLSPSEMPFAQKFAVVKVILGGCAGIIAASVSTYLLTYAELPGKRWGSWRFWLWLVLLVLTAGLLGGFTNTKSYLIPTKEIAVAWAPFRISFTASYLISFGLAISVLLVLKVAKKRDNMSRD